MHRRALSAVLLLLAGLAHDGRGVSGAPTVIYVDQHAGGSNDGTSWTNAYAALQDALAAAPANSEIWVAGGSYRPGISNTSTFTLKNDVAVYGGFAGTETLRSQRDIAANATILAGHNIIDHVVTGTGVGSTAVLDGFTITGGTGGGASGGGILLTSSNATFANLSIAGNHAAAFGGGVFSNGGSPAFMNVVFSHNSAGSGGGFGATAGGTPSFTNVVFDGNSATVDGGGLWSASGTSPTINGALFSGNGSMNEGGGLLTAGGTAVISNALFVLNSAYAAGGGVVIESGATATYTNVTFARNQASSGGAVYTLGPSSSFLFSTFVGNRSAAGSGGALLDNNTSATIDRSVIWNNGVDPVADILGGPQTSVKDSTLQGGCTPGTTCTNTSSADPLLQPLANNGGLTRTYALGAGSPAIDAASSCGSVAVDQRGLSRPVDGNKDGTPRCDYGALEQRPASSAVSFTSPAASGLEGVATVYIPVKLSTPAISPVTVKYAVTGGTAAGGKDYTLKSGTLTFPPLVTTQNIPLTITADNADEPNETIVVVLSAPTAAILGSPATHTHTIKDDDPTYRCRGRLATIVGTTAKDTLTGTRGADVIVGLDGNDTIEGGGGDDLVCAGPGNDTVGGGNGNDALLGEGGNDSLKGDKGADLVFGGGGKDRLAGGASGGDACDGGPGAADVLLPGDGCESTSGVP